MAVVASAFTRSFLGQKKTKPKKSKPKTTRRKKPNGKKV